jgi:hypothetical protein
MFANVLFSVICKHFFLTNYEFYSTFYEFYSTFRHLNYEKFSTSDVVNEYF